MVDKNFIGLDKPDITRFESYLPTAFSSELTLLQKVNKIIQDLNRNFDLTNEMVDYLNRFIESFDEKLYETIEDILNVWVEDGRLADVVRVAISEEVIEARTDYLGHTYLNLKERLDHEREEVILARGESQTLGERLDESDVQLSQNVINIKAYGAVGDGLTDDTQAIKQAIADLDNNVLLLPHGKYRITENIEINKNINIRGDNSTIVLDGNVNISVKGGMRETLAKFTNDVSKGVRSFSVTDPTDIIKNDLLLLIDINDFSFSEYRSYYYDGEFVNVLDVFGTTINITSQLETSYGMTSNFKIYKMLPVQVNIDNLTIVKSNKFNTRNCLSLENVSNSKLTNVKLENGNSNDALFLLRAYNLVFNQVDVRNTSTATEQNGYGLVMRSCQRLSVYDSSFYARRHASAVGAGAVEACPISRHINFYNTTFTSFSEANNTHSADFHGSIKNGYYHNCVFYGGVVLAGEDTAVYGGTVYGKGAQGGMYYREIKGGTIEYRDINYVTDNEHSAFSYHSSSEMHNIVGHVKYIIKNVNLHYNNNLGSSIVLISTGSTNGANLTVDISGLSINKTPTDYVLHLLAPSVHNIELEMLKIEDINVEPRIWYNMPTSFGVERSRITLPTVTYIDTINITQSLNKNITLNSRYLHKNSVITFTIISQSESVPISLSSGAMLGSGGYVLYFPVYARNYGDLPETPINVQYMITVSNQNLKPVY